MYDDDWPAGGWPEEDYRRMSLLAMRRETGLTQSQAAERAGMLRHTYAAIEQGATAPLLADDASAIARALNAEVDAIAVAHSASRALHLGRANSRRGRHDDFG